MNTSAFIPFARPDIGEEEIAAVAHAMRSGWVTTGPETRAFEQEFGDFLQQAAFVFMPYAGRRRWITH